jgi:hypothetical protein
MRCNYANPKVATLLLLFLSLSGCVHAQTGISNGAAISNGAKIIPPPQPLCLITTNSLPGATQGVFFSQTIQTSNCAAPVTFSITAGALPTWVSTIWPNTTGKIEGTPGSGDVGTSPSFTVTATDANGHQATFNAGFSVTTSGAAGTPALPDTALLTWNTTVANTPSPNSVVTIGAGTTGICAPAGCTYQPNQLSTAANAVTCGQTLVMQNTLYQVAGTVTFKQVCDQAHWITIARDTNDATFPAEGTRVTPCYSGIPSSALPGYPAYPCTSPARHMPYIQKTSAGAVINIFGTSYRFVGIEWGRNNSYDLDFGILNLSNSTACTAPDLTCMNAQPTFNLFDRNIIHGDAQRQTVKAIAGGGTRWLGTLDSYIYDIQVTYLGGAGDAFPMAWGNGTNFTNSGWGKFANTFFAASTEGTEFCGSFTEPLSPSTGFDGIPHDFWFAQDWFYKNILWDTQRGQTLNASIVNEGVTYPPAAGQEFIQLPSAIQLAVNQAYQVQTWTANDSNGGINRSQAGTNALTCGGCANPGSVSTVFSTVGSGVHQSQSQFITTYTAPSTIPANPVTYTRCWNTGDSRSGTIGNSRQLCASTVFTIVASNPVERLVIGPSAPDLQIQPSYSDSNGNSRQFCLQFNAIPNFANSGGITWQVDGIVGGNATIGTIDSTGLYCSPSSTGLHTILANTLDSGLFNIDDTSTITVSNTAPILGFDGRPITSKNGFELKCGGKFLVENFYIENAWGSNGNGNGQGGQTFLIHPFNQNGCPSNCNTSVLAGNTPIGYGPFYVADGTIRNGKAEHMGAGFVIGGSANTLGIKRVSASNILCSDCSYKRWSNGFNLVTYFDVQGNGGGSTVYSWESSSNPMARDIAYSHITDVGDVPINTGNKGGTFGISQNVAQPPTINYSIKDSIFPSNGSTTFYDPAGGTTCNTNGALGINNTELKALPCFAVTNGLTLSHIALLDSTNTITPGADWPDAATLWQPASSDAGLFRNYNGGVGGDYRVVAGGIYDAGGARDASDGTALGADVNSINTVETNVRNGVRTP